MKSGPWDLRERTFCYARDIVVFCRELSKNPGIPRQIAVQLLRSGTSVGANVEEAKAAYSRREFASKNSVALKEAREARYWLRLIEATNLTSIPQGLLEESDALVAIFTAVVKKSRISLPAGRGRGRAIVCK